MNTITISPLQTTLRTVLTTRRVTIGALSIGMALFAVLGLQIVYSSDLVTPAGTPVGGDFAAFWTAAKAMAAGDAAAIYTPDNFFAWLERVAPPQERWGLTWQYPPTYFFAIAILAMLPYGLGYAVWTGGGLALFAASVRAAGVRNEVLVIVIACPAVFQTFITGQNGFLTASLLLGATMLVDKRPLAAGLCAALLTMKPQLGLLLPVAYLAGGHWRSFSAAAVGSIALASASVAVFGVETWQAFFESLRGVGQNINSGLMPLYKMPTVYATALMGGAPTGVAQALHIIGALLAALATFCVWKRSANPALKAAVVACGAFLVAPYGYYYELTIMVAPITLLALQASQKGWRPVDQLILLGLFALPLALPGEPKRTGINIAIFVTLLAIVFLLPRIRDALTQPKTDVATS